MKKLRYVLIALLAIGLVIIVGYNIARYNSNNSSGNEKQIITLYKSELCGCCELYAKYLDKQGFEIEVIQMDDLTLIKEKYRIIESMQSCHTVAMGNYFIEGHMPKEAIEKLLAEKPDIAGITLPGMPLGSPGMPGSKQGPFIVYAVQKDGTTTEFMRI